MFAVKDSTSTSSTCVEPNVNHTYKIRLHPQGNKSSNLEFTFFQIFSLAQNAKFKAKFYVYNSNNEEISTTVYSGAQQLNGFFQYVRRAELLKHIEADDELRLSVSVTTYSDTVMRQGNYLKKETPEVLQDDSLSHDYEKAFNDDRFSDFKIICGEKKQVLNVHRVLLASRSQYFSALLSPHTREYETGRLELPDVDFEIFSEFIFWLYTGRSPKLRSMALDMLSLSDRFQAPHLKDMSAKVLASNLRIDNACDVLVKADLHNSTELKDECLDFIVLNSNRILKTPQWELLLKDHSNLVTEICLAMSEDSSKQIPFEPMSKRVRLG